MSRENDLASFLIAQGVGISAASSVAESLLDAGWASPEELNRVAEDAYNESQSQIIETISAYRKDYRNLRGKSLSATEMIAAQKGLTAGSGIAYGRYENEIQLTLLALIEHALKSNKNPFAV